MDIRDAIELSELRIKVAYGQDMSQLEWNRFTDLSGGVI